ncbi:MULTISPECIES: 50S ribosomal protein L3 [Methylocaldum]|jgi:large subunit ribosomal protein L3|uniref:50S ribosomal protein L3 n=1 Tax=unclassified Methylocaldum TaxID=2622260 RepID=UPI000A326A37|nr:50S ribosomal protein L3 [Methylocaldum sp. RMAD-M]MVF22744.1 50S ribosomal protein L3 [Methylocaldum sp. BRCS4]
MALGLVGRKCGMTRIYAEDGSAVPVSVIHVEPNRVVQVKALDTDGYRAIQVTAGVKKRSRLSRPEAGHYAKAGVEAGRGLWEFRVEEGDAGQYSVGSEVGVDIFQEGQYVDVQGMSIGKGFAGVVKRHNFRTQDATHGNSLSHRAPGSIGQNQTPGRVFKGKRMAGHLGSVTTTVQSLKVCAVDKERSLLLIKGAVPGAKGAEVLIKPAVKK